MMNASSPAPPVKGGVLQAHDGSMHRLSRAPQTRMAPLTGAPTDRQGSRQSLSSAQHTPSAAQVTGEVLQDREFAAPRSGVGEGASHSRRLPPDSAVAPASPVLSGPQPPASAVSTDLPACKLRAGQPPGTPWWVWVAPDHASITESRYKEKSPGDDPSETWASHGKGPPPTLGFSDWDYFAIARRFFDGLAGT